MAGTKNAALKTRHAELVSASMAPTDAAVRVGKWTLKQVQGDDVHRVVRYWEIDDHG
jgi:hypothetical protein